jgi:predicted ATP-dependent serine protease
MSEKEHDVLDMTDRGMVEVTNPSALFLSTATVWVKNEQVSIVGRSLDYISADIFYSS